MLNSVQNLSITFSLFEVSNAITFFFFTSKEKEKKNKKKKKKIAPGVCFR
jgi:hypothetical protein